MQAKLHKWMWAGGLNQWIPDYTLTVDVVINRQGNYVVEGWSDLIFDRKTLVLVNRTPRKTFPSYLFYRWPKLELI